MQLETDNKPLVAIFKKKALNDCLARLQRIRLKVQKYDPGKSMHAVDALSCAAMTEKTVKTDEIEQELESQLTKAIKYVPIRDQKIKEIEKRQYQTKRCKYS